MSVKSLNAAAHQVLIVIWWSPIQLGCVCGWRGFTLAPQGVHWGRVEVRQNLCYFPSELLSALLSLSLFSHHHRKTPPARETLPDSSPTKTTFIIPNLNIPNMFIVKEHSHFFLEISSLYKSSRVKQTALLA